MGSFSTGKKERARSCRQGEFSPSRSQVQLGNEPKGEVAKNFFPHFPAEFGYILAEALKEQGRSFSR
jgi:hypothetical protein